MDNHLLKVSAGPDYDHLQVVAVNDCLNPLFINSQHFCGYLMVRIVNFNGLGDKPNATPKPMPSFDYFQGKQRRYSIMVQGRFKQSHGADDLIFGGDFDGDIDVPVGASLAVGIAKWLDPAIIASTQKNPFMFSPMVTAMNALAVLNLDSHHLVQSGTEFRNYLSADDSDYLNVGDWSFHSKHVPENTDALTLPLQFTSYEKRKKVLTF
jgi:hypothetical protein